MTTFLNQRESVSETNLSKATSRRNALRLLGGGAAATAATLLIAGCGGSSGSSTGAGPSVFEIPASEIANAFHNIKTDEDTHVAFLVSALGAAARPAPTFSAAALTAPDVATFHKDSGALENTGTGAYLYFAKVGSSLAASAYLQTAAGIAIVEGRHTGFLNALNGKLLLTDPANDTTLPPNSVEVPQAPDEVNARAAPFLVGVNLNGGPAPLTTATAATASVTDILNYALLLEYLEKTFYDINVPRFYP